MSSPKPDPDWQEDSVIAGEAENRELDLEDTSEDVKALNRIVIKQQERIAQLESILDKADSYVQLLGDVYHVHKDAQ